MLRNVRFPANKGLGFDTDSVESYASFIPKFRKLGFISYDGKINVHSSLLHAVLHEARNCVKTNRPYIRVGRFF